MQETHHSRQIRLTWRTLASEGAQCVVLVNVHTRVHMTLESEGAQCVVLVNVHTRVHVQGAIQRIVGDNGSLASLARK